MSETFRIGDQDTDAIIRIRLETDFREMSTGDIVYEKGTSFNLLSQEDGYVFAETLDGSETVAIDFGDFKVLWVKPRWYEEED